MPATAWPAPSPPMGASRSSRARRSAGLFSGTTGQESGNRSRSGRPARRTLSRITGLPSGPAASRCRPMGASWLWGAVLRGGPGGALRAGLDGGRCGGGGGRPCPRGGRGGRGAERRRRGTTRERNGNGNVMSESMNGSRHPARTATITPHLPTRRRPVEVGVLEVGGKPGGKPGIRAQVLEHRVDLQIREPAIALLPGRIQHGKGLVEGMGIG